MSDPIAKNDVVTDTMSAMSTITVKISDTPFTVRAGDQGYTTYNAAAAVQMAKGKVRLNIVKVDGKWQSSGLLGPNLGYGTYEIEVSGRLDSLDPWTVFAFWLYDDATKNEVDVVESTRWGDTNSPNLLHATQWTGGANPQATHFPSRPLNKFRFRCTYSATSCVVDAWGLQLPDQKWKDLYHVTYPSMPYGNPRLALWVPASGALTYSLARDMGPTYVTVDKFSFIPAASTGVGVVGIAG